MKCCICGKEIVDEIHDGNNPDPLKDENGKFLADTEHSCCCADCNKVYVLPYRMCEIYGVKDQMSKIQNKVLKIRKGWLNK